jgi:hypothetical protein
VLLGVELEADALDQVELGLEEVDVMFLILHQLFEQVAADIVLDAMAVGRRFLVERARGDLGCKIAFDDLSDVLADPQGIEHLHVGKAVEKKDAIGELVGVLHLFDGFLAPDLGHFQEAPIVQDPVVQPILVDRGKFAAQALVEVIDDLGIALHRALRCFGRNRPESD